MRILKVTDDKFVGISIIFLKNQIKETNTYNTIEQIATMNL